MDAMELRTVLRDNVEALRGDMTGAELARRGGCSQKSVSHVLNLERDVQMSTVAALARALGTQPWRLLQPGGSSSEDGRLLNPERLARAIAQADRAMAAEGVSKDSPPEARAALVSILYADGPGDDAPDQEWSTATRMAVIVGLKSGAS